MKLCIDCAWYSPSDKTSAYSNLDKCSNPDWIKVDFVRGEHSKPYCESERMAGGRCKPDAQGFTYSPGEPVLEVAEDGAF